MKTMQCKTTTGEVITRYLPETPEDSAWLRRRGSTSGGIGAPRSLEDELRDDNYVESKDATIRIGPCPAGPRRPRCQRPRR